MRINYYRTVGSGEPLVFAELYGVIINYKGAVVESVVSKYF